MRSSNPCAFTFAALLSLPLAASVAQTIAAGGDTRTSAPASAASLAILERYMVPVEAELTGKLNSRTAAAGQQVTAKTRETVKLADGTTLPKGTTLIGHVTQAQAQTQDQPYARLAMIFDRAELKNGQSVGLRSEVRMVAPPANTAFSSPDPMMGDAAGGPVGGNAPAAGMGAGPARGGVDAASGQPAGPMRPVGQTASSTLGGPGADAHSLAEAAAESPGGVVQQAGETVSAAPRATGVPGVLLSTSAAAGGPGTLMAAGANIALDAGTRITLGVIAR